MLKKWLAHALGIALLLQGVAAQGAAAFKIVTADPKGTYFAIGNDLAKLVGPGADIDLEVVPTDGSAANIKVTGPDDLALAARLLRETTTGQPRIGFGADVHAFGPGDHV